MISEILRDWKSEETETLKKNHMSNTPFKATQAFGAYLHQVVAFGGSVLMRFRAKLQCCEAWFRERS